MTGQWPSLNDTPEQALAKEVALSERYCAVLLVLARVSRIPAQRARFDQMHAEWRDHGLRARLLWEQSCSPPA